MFLPFFVFQFPFVPFSHHHCSLLLFANVFSIFDFYSYLSCFLFSLFVLSPPMLFLLSNQVHLKLSFFSRQFSFPFFLFFHFFSVRLCLSVLVCLCLSASLRACRWPLASSYFRQCLRLPVFACARWFVSFLCSPVPVCAFPCWSAAVSVCVCVCVCLSARVCACLWRFFLSGLRESTSVGTRKSVTNASQGQIHGKKPVEARCHTDVHVVRETGAHG